MVVPWLTCDVFIGAKMRLDVGFHAAQARLENLAHDGLLYRASNDAYQEWTTTMARIGPLGAAPGMSKLVRVQFRDIVIHDDSAVLTLRWEATGTASHLFPILDADITLAPAGEDSTTLALSGVYRPPLGGLGERLDRAILHRIAEATIQAFAHHIEAAITHPATSPGAVQSGILPEAFSRPEPETP